MPTGWSPIPTATAFVEEFGELYDCLPEDGDDGRCLSDLYNLFQRHQQFVAAALEKQIVAHNAALRRGDLSPDSLLRMVCGGAATADPRVAFVENLRELLIAGLRPSFQRRKPKNETELQDVGEGLLAAAKQDMAREAPMLPFSSVLTKPDFSSTPDGHALFVEYKYVRNRAGVNKVITEMTSRVTVYRDQGAWVLFVVYDPASGIKNDVKFKKDFEKHEGISVTVVR